MESLWELEEDDAIGSDEGIVELPVDLELPVRVLVVALVRLPAQLLDRVADGPNHLQMGWDTFRKGGQLI